IIVDTKEEAFAKIKELIPAGASVMNGASTTLQQIGYIDYLKGGEHGWNNVHEAIVNEKDPVKQNELRRQALLSDFYLGSVHAMAQTGEMVIASNSGSQLPHIVFSSPNVVFVVGTNKIVPTLEDARMRLREHVVPLEDERMKSVGMGGTALNKEFIFHAEPTYTGRNITVLFVKETLGF
ncbi:lactate utilization protein, partial [Patescibacteria group bacterium]|nr:lactate utilization protein [Patescibacteria group bacterium]